MLTGGSLFFKTKFGDYKLSFFHVPFLLEIKNTPKVYWLIYMPQCEILTSFRTVIFKTLQRSEDERRIVYKSR